MTRAEKGLKILKDIAIHQPKHERKEWIRGGIEELLNEPEHFKLTQEDIAVLKQELLKYL
ncbi:MAG: hypothetical protein ACI3XA_09505 [Clostridia bacterium]